MSFYLQVVAVCVISAAAVGVVFGCIADLIHQTDQPDEPLVLPEGSPDADRIIPQMRAREAVLI